ncbi:MAG: family 10 glycosylhydrolase [Muribaculaceae bacterium]
MKSIAKLCFLAALMLATSSAYGQVDVKTPKHEMRSAWVATVWGIDWPLSTTSGSESSINTQKAQMTKMLDSLAVNNFNSVNFQVRGMCDAMYKSSYEPWASWLTGTRGKDPGWDPFEYFVEECHKRGLECHAWVNPYRFNSSSTSGGQAGDATGYMEKGWTISGSSGVILNPGIPEVQDQIVKVCKEIISNYDVDGMLFDDYYYNGAALSEDTDLYNSYVEAGGTLSQANWRRKNVTDLMRKLYKMIEETKPWVRFGQAPQGTTYTDQSLADKYGIEKCPVGYDNNYGSQYIDIIEWLDQGLIDYISPQVYWTIEHTTNPYIKIVPWWSKVVNKFGRHLFVSQSISSLTSSSNITYSSTSAATAPEESSDGTPADVEASSGPNNTTFAEYANEITINRSSSLNGSCGSIFYSVKYIYSIGSQISFGHFLKRHMFSRAALLPAMTWKTQASDPGKVANLSYDEESLLTWDALSNMRYSVYAVPNGVNPESFAKEVDYLLGTSYNNSFTVPEDYRCGYYFAVCAYDRYGNEWEPSFWKPTYSETLNGPALVQPATGLITNTDFTFKWRAVSDAEHYVVVFSTDENFTTIQKTVQTTERQLELADVYNYISKNVPIYWRVYASAKGKNDGVSEARWFKFVLVSLTSPANGATELDPKVYFEWNSSGEEATLEVATDEAFENVVLSHTTTENNYQAKVLELHPLTTYFARANVNGRSSDFITFSTKAMPCVAPQVVNPLNGGICYSDGRVEVNKQDGAQFVTIQVDETDAFGSSRAQKNLENFSTGIDISEILINRKDPLEDGKTYYARANASYYASPGALYTTDWSEVISFVYNSGIDGIGSITGNNPEVGIVGNELYVKNGKPGRISVKAITLLGVQLPLCNESGNSVQVDLGQLPAGIYVICVENEGFTRTIKYVKR